MTASNAALLLSVMPGSNPPRPPVGRFIDLAGLGVVCILPRGCSGRNCGSVQMPGAECEHLETLPVRRGQPPLIPTPERERTRKLLLDQEPRPRAARRRQRATGAAPTAHPPGNGRRALRSLHPTDRQGPQRRSSGFAALSPRQQRFQRPPLDCASNASATTAPLEPRRSLHCTVRRRSTASTLQPCA